MWEGIVIVIEQEVKEDIVKLLCYEFLVLFFGQLISFLEYVSCMWVGICNIYYLCVFNCYLVEYLFYYEVMKKKDIEVFFCFEQFDEFILLYFCEFDKKKLIFVEMDIVVDYYKEEKFEDRFLVVECLLEKEMEEFMVWMRNVLGLCVINVKVIF